MHDDRFQTLLDETQRAVRAYIAGLGVPAHEVDDRAQDVYLELYKTFDRMPEGVPPLKWIKGIAKNVCLSEFRKTSRRSAIWKSAFAELLDRTHSHVDPVGADEGSQVDAVSVALSECVASLPDAKRDVIELKYRRDLSSDEIASSIGSTAEAVRVLLYRIRSGLKQCVEGRLQTAIGGGGRAG